MTWKTVTVLTDTDEGAGIAFDDSHNCYYTTMQGGLFPVCVVSRDGGMTWSQPAASVSATSGCRGARQDRALRVRSPEHRSLRIHTGWGLNWTVHDFTDSGLEQRHWSVTITGTFTSYTPRWITISKCTRARSGPNLDRPDTIVAGNAF